MAREIHPAVPTRQANGMIIQEVFGDLRKENGLVTDCGSLQPALYMSMITITMLYIEVLKEIFIPVEVGHG